MMAQVDPYTVANGGFLLGANYSARAVDANGVWYQWPNLIASHRDFFDSLIDVWPIAVRETIELACPALDAAPNTYDLVLLEFAEVRASAISPRVLVKPSPNADAVRVVRKQLDGPLFPLPSPWA